jgi:hypothetical protein
MLAVSCFRLSSRAQENDFVAAADHFAAGAPVKSVHGFESEGIAQQLRPHASGFAAQAG